MLQTSRAEYLNTTLSGWYPVDTSALATTAATETVATIAATTSVAGEFVVVADDHVDTYLPLIYR
jgi:hypothetical protein